MREYIFAPTHAQFVHYCENQSHGDRDIRNYRWVQKAHEMAGTTRDTMVTILNSRFLSVPQLGEVQQIAFRHPLKYVND